MSQDPTRNPFDTLGIDPRSTPEQITARMREMAEEAEPEERRRLQGLWRQLTLHPDERLRTAFFAHAAPSGALPDLNTMEGEALSRRFMVARPGRPLAVPEVFESPLPPVADLVLLPPLRPSVARRRHQTDATDRRPWPDVAPEDDVFLKL